jgi:Na+/phosphate symporter
MHCTNDAERIADHTDNILKLTKRLNKTGRKLSDVAVHDLNKLWTVLDAQANSVTLALASSSDKGNVQNALEQERKVNKLAKKYEKNYTRKNVYYIFLHICSKYSTPILSAPTVSTILSISIKPLMY